MLSEFSWLQILQIAGWPLWIVLACNSLILTFMVQRFFSIFRSLRVRKSWFIRQSNDKTQKLYERLFFHDHKKTHIFFPLIKNLMIIAPLLGLLGSLFNFIHILHWQGIAVFNQKSMFEYLLITLGAPFIVGICASIFSILLLLLYIRSSHIFIQAHSIHHK